MKKILTLLTLLLSLNSFSQLYADVSYRLGYNKFRKINPSVKYEIGFNFKEYYSFGVGFGEAQLSQVTKPNIYNSFYYEPKFTVNTNPGKLAFIGYGGYLVYNRLPIGQGYITLGMGASIPINNNLTTTLMISRADMNEYLSVGLHYSF